MRSATADLGVDASTLVVEAHVSSLQTREWIRSLAAIHRNSASELLCLQQLLERGPILLPPTGCRLDLDADRARTTCPNEVDFGA